MKADAATLKEMYGCLSPAARPRKLVFQFSSPLVISSQEEGSPVREVAGHGGSSSSRTQWVEFMDNSCGILKRRSLDGTSLQSAEMKPGTNGFLEAKFADGDWKETEVPNIIKSLLEQQVCLPFRKKPAAAKARPKKHKNKAKLRKRKAQEPALAEEEEEEEEEVQEGEQQADEDEVDELELDSELAVIPAAAQSPDQDSAAEQGSGPSTVEGQPLYATEKLKLTTATAQSYIQGKAGHDKKFTLLVAMSAKQAEDHPAKMRKILDALCKKEFCTKAQALQMRTKLIG